MINYGWVCPKCGTAVNPSVATCPCNDNGQYTPFQPFTPKPFNPIEEIKKVVIETTEGSTVTTNPNRPYTIIY